MTIMKKILIITLLSLLPTVLYADDDLTLSGMVKSAITKQDLTDAKVIFYDKDGNPKDTIQANMGLNWDGFEEIVTSVFSYNVPRVDSTYVFDVICEGFESTTQTYTVKNVGKRETYREIPTIYLKRASVRNLDGVTVTATKVKFYNKGDTLVYDASAFQLDEGSMLDALVAQLPGVELSTDGQIKVNGHFVESLLLDGKEFFDEDNNIMLENIAAYTVKDIQVYEGVSDKDKAMGRDFNKVLTMDVRLKKEYNIGWLINAQGGYGTEDRYIGRLMAAWFNPQWRVSVVGNLNNLNDNRAPGRNDTWTPEQMPSGRIRNAMAGIQYNYETPERDKQANGSLTFNQSSTDIETRTDLTNFLQSGNTYQKSFSNSNNKNTRLGTQHWFNFGHKDFNFAGSVIGSYIHSTNSNTNLSGTFNQNQDSISFKTLDAIYSGGNQKVLETVINRSKTQSDGWTKSYNLFLSSNTIYNIPKTSDRLMFFLDFDYSSIKDELWKDYDVNYGPVYENPERRRQFFDNTPNYYYSLSPSLTYSMNISRVYLNFQYSYSFIDRVKDSYMYALDRLNDMGVYGSVPAGYLESFDPNNSYKSRMITNNNSLSLSINGSWDLSKDANFSMNFIPDLQLIHRKLNYWRNDTDYRLSKTNLGFYLRTWWNAHFELRFRKRGEEGNEKYTNSIVYRYETKPTLPDMFDMVDVVNDSDPLNIYYGNPDLKQQIYQRYHLHWELSPYSHTLTNTFYVNYMWTKNALTRGYTYDTNTGIRFNKMYNVNGDHTFELTDEIKWQFGCSKQFTISSYSEAEWTQYVDMIGINMEEPALAKVRTRRLTENFKFSWQVGKSNLSLRCDVNNRHTTSYQEGFTNLNATDIISGASALVNLPAGFSINTDFLLYTRRGYGVESLDTTDPVWNIRLSYCPPKNKKWVFMVDGFDMLHTLSNVNYAVNAAGRTVTYTNVLPRYFLFSIQYRLNIQPKKK